MNLDECDIIGYNFVYAFVFCISNGKMCLCFPMLGQITVIELAINTSKYQ